MIQWSKTTVLVAATLLGAGAPGAAAAADRDGETTGSPAQTAEPQQAGAAEELPGRAPRTAPEQPDPRGGKARGTGEEGLSRIEIEPAAALPPGEVQRMRRWHARYAAAVRPVRRALGAVLARRAADGKDWPGPPGGREDLRLRAACRQLGGALEEITEGDVFPAPEFAIDVHLRRALDDLGRAATACRDGRGRGLRHYLALAAGAFSNASLALRPYGLAP